MTFQRIFLALAICVALAAPVTGQSVTPEEAGVLALQAGEFDKAASIFADALRRGPRDPRLHLGAGVAAHFRGRNDEARTFLTRALELEPRFTAASGLLGEIAYEQGDVDLAIRIYEQALKYAPTSVPIRDALKAWRADAAKERRVDGPFSIAFEGPAEARLDPRSFDRVLTHELAHAMIAGMARRGVPAWLHEGLATFFEGADVSRAEQRWKAARTLIPPELLQEGFTRFDEREARVADDQSVVAASVLVDRLGPNVALLLHDLDLGNEFPLALTRVGFAYADFEGELTRRLK